MSSGAWGGAAGRPWRLLLAAGGVVAAGLLGAPPPAFATATLDCNADDKSVSFEAHSVVSHGLAEGFSNFRAVLTVKAKGVSEDFARLELDGAALAHHWLYGKELKLRLYHERTEGPHGFVELVVQTRGGRGDDDGEFGGRYLLTLLDAGQEGKPGKEITLRGKVACSVG